MQTSLITGASQLAALRAQRAGEGFSREPAVKLSGPEFNNLDPKYRPELDPNRGKHNRS